MATRLRQVTATGQAAVGPVRLKSAVLTGAAAAATADLDDSLAGAGVDLLSLSAPAGGTASWTSGDPDGVFFGTALHATLTGAGAKLSIEYE